VTSRDASPACWSWEPPTEAFREEVRARYGAAARLLGGDFGTIVMSEWQQDRCAACGCNGALAEDHDHVTGLIRGYLCRRCNQAEGIDDGSSRVWREYRERNPASICGVEAQYYDSFAKEFAEPAQPHDKWKNHPMRGVGL
jgi:hypothetical protein